MKKKHNKNGIKIPYHLENPLDIPSLVGASFALSISDIPFSEPISACRVGYVDGEYIINPSYSQIESSELDIVVAGSKSGITMLEAGATEVSEEVVLEAIKQGQLENEKLIKCQNGSNSRKHFLLVHCNLHDFSFKIMFF